MLMRLHVALPIDGSADSSMLHLLCGRWAGRQAARADQSCGEGTQPHPCLGSATNPALRHSLMLHRAAFSSGLLSMSLPVFFLPVVAELVSPGRQQRPLAHEHQPQEAAQVARQRVEPEQDLAGVLVLRQRVVALGAEA